MNRPVMEFHFREPTRFPQPYPAKELPLQWAEASAEADPTVRNMLVASTAGFIIPLAYDCEFQTDEKGHVSYRSVGAPIATQEHFQYLGTWFQHLPVIKFANPWIIKTPPGYCTLVLPAINRFDMPFEPLAGVVETDTYYQEIFFPTLCYLAPGQSFALPRGTPLVQVVPVPREPWRSIIRRLDADPAAT